MTVVEFLAPLKKNPHKDRVLAAMYYAHRYEGTDVLTTEDIKNLMIRARVPKAKDVNVADVLLKAGELVDSPGSIGNRKQWELTKTGKQYVQALLNLPSESIPAEVGLGTLTSLMTKVSDPDLQGYINEVLKCLEAGALRATVVFLWAAAVRELQQRILGFPLTAVNTALSAHAPKARAVKSIDDLAYVKESHLLLVAQDLMIFDRNERQMMEQALELRNKCGHPGKYNPGPKKVAAFVEDVLKIVWHVV